jgi:hypothetical protein
MITLVKVIAGLFLIALAVCLGGMNVSTWEMVFWPQGDVMKNLQWTSAIMALLGAALTVIVGGCGLFLLFCHLPKC